MTIQDIFSDPDIRWHQRFDVDGETSPGYHDMNVLMTSAQLPEDLSGVTVIDIGTTNGATAFECERRGAKEVVLDLKNSPDILVLRWSSYKHRSTSSQASSEVKLLTIASFGGFSITCAIHYSALMH